MYERLTDKASHASLYTSNSPHLMCHHLFVLLYVEITFPAFGGPLEWVDSLV